MRVFYDLDSLPRFKKAVLTIGTFDGVHVGHRLILEQVRKVANEVNGETVLITFDPHPRLALNPASDLSLLTTLPERLKALESLGIDNVVIVNFDKAFANQQAKDYIQYFLINHFHPTVIVIGYDHQFGKDRSGDFRLFEKYKEIFNYQLVEIPAKAIEDSAVSSTRIRHAIQKGDLQTATILLGRPYSFSGHVIHGDKRGRTIGFPTANVEVIDIHKLLPARGVYAVNVSYKAKLYNAMMNIGLRPTVEESNKLKIEIHLIDFNTEIYDEILDVNCIYRIRDEVKFESINQLIVQLQEDRKEALKILNSTKI